MVPPRRSALRRPRTAFWPAVGPVRRSPTRGKAAGRRGGEGRAGVEGGSGGGGGCRGGADGGGVGGRLVAGSPRQAAQHGTPLAPAELGAHIGVAFSGAGEVEQWAFGNESRDARVA